ncbi:MAG: MarR family transcriptional regulator [Pseudomonadales bacterium]|nr:MarR family transcriptional regulator [Pseudomonadales bacterium]
MTHKKSGSIVALEKSESNSQGDDAGLIKKREKRYRSNLGRNLHTITRDLQRELMAKNAESGYEGLKLGWDALFLHMSFMLGVRVVDLAEANELSKQAMSQLVNEIEGYGYVERRPDPVDGRAKRVFFTEKGMSLINNSIAAISEVEEGYSELIGEEKVNQLKSICNELAVKLIHRDVERKKQQEEKTKKQ